MLHINKNKIKLITYPNPILEKQAVKLDDNDFNSQELGILCDLMKKYINKYDGIGLAAPQINVSAQVILIAPKKDEMFFLVNPEITHFSNEKVLASEGCLSFPKIFGNVLRSDEVEVSAYNEKGEQIKMQAKGLVARVIQHEVDHLNGELFVDKVEKITHGEEILDELRSESRI